MYVILMGMMGSGKSAIGKALARNLRVPFFDIDTLIEGHFGISITDVFSVFGEPAFREAEETIMLRMAGVKRRGVISLGGGSVLSNPGMKALKQVGTCVYLRGSVQTLLVRASRRIHRRPLLLHAIDPEKALENLLKLREPLYLEYADLIIDIDQGSITDLAHAICRKVGR